LDAILIPARDTVEVVLHLGGEVVLHELAEVLLEQAYDGERDPVGDERLAARGDVAAVDDGRDNGRVRGRAADAELFELLDEAGLRVARRRTGLVALGL